MELEKFHSVINSANPSTIVDYATKNISDATKATKIVEQWTDATPFSYV